MKTSGAWGRQVKYLVGLSMLAVLTAVSPALAGTTYTLTTEFSGSGSGDLTNTLSVSIVDDGAGNVTVTMTANFADDGNFVGEVYMNFDPDSSVASLDITQDSGPTATVSQDADAFKADGDGNFDILFTFGANEFDNDNNEAIFTITCSTCGFTIDQTNFETTSETAPGNQTTWHVAAHIQGLGGDNEGSGFYGDGGNGTGGIGGDVPVPATLLLLGAGLVGLAVGPTIRRGIRRRR